MANVPIALQMYTVREEAAKDFCATVRRIARMGYAGIEGGVDALEAEELRDLLEETRLLPAASMVDLARLEAELDAMIAYHQTIRCRYVGVPYLPKELQTREGYYDVARRLNRLGEALRQEGLSLFYHNHAFEFARYDGEQGWEILARETDPTLVALELDVYWATYGGEDPTALIREHARRFPLLHIKDMTGEGEARTFTEVGEGHIDMLPILAVAEDQGVQWYIVEQDRCARPCLESADISLRNLRRMMAGR